MKQKLIELKGRSKFTTAVETSTLLSQGQRSTEQWKQPNGIHRTLHSRQESTYSSAHGIFKFQIDHVLGHKTNLNKLKK